MRGHFAPHPRHYEDYYIRQVGHGGPVFQGSKTQKGFGLGGILGGILKSAMPLIKQGAKTLGREALRAGVGITQDVLEGRNLRTSAKTRLKRAGRSLTQQAIHGMDARSTSAGRKGIKRKATGRRVTSARGKRKKRSLDIFD